MRVLFVETFEPLLTLNVPNSDVLPSLGHRVNIGKHRYFVTAVTWTYERTSNLMQSHKPSVQIDVRKDVG